MSGEKKEIIRDEKGRIVTGSGPINPTGRPEGSLSVVDAIRQKLKQKPPGKSKEYLHYLVETVLKKAIQEENVVMIRDIIDRMDGKPPQLIDLSSLGEPITHATVEIVHGGNQAQGNERPRTEPPKQK